MSRKNEQKSSGWGDWAAKRNDWNISKNNDKRPKLDIHKSHLSQSSSTSNSKATSVAVAGPSAGRGGSFRRTNSMPTTSKASPLKDGVAFVDTIQEEFDAEEAERLAEAAAAIELQMAQTQVVQDAAATASKPPIASNVIYGNNGSSGFENLFTEEIAAEDVEECMLLASQEIQASQNAQVEAETSFSQAYAVFSKGANVHSSVMDTGPSFKVPPAPGSSAPGSSKPILSLAKTNKPSANFQPSFGRLNQPFPSRPPSSYNPSKSMASNPQAETEVRRLSKVQEENSLEIKKLKDHLRTKEGECAILRSQLRQALVEKEQHVQRCKRSEYASEQQYNEKLSELGKELEALKDQLKFQKAEANADKQRYKLLSNGTERLRLVEPQSPGSLNVTQQYAGPSKTPSRQKHVSSFLNRSTFEEAVSPGRPAKRARISEEEERPILNLPLPEPPMPLPPPPVLKPETRTVGEQTSFDGSDDSQIQKLSALTLGQALSEKLLGFQLASLESPIAELFKNDDSCFDEKETIPTISLLKEGPKSRQRCDVLDDVNRPSLKNCGQSLRHLMSWNDPMTDCPPTKDSIRLILEECSGILHYNLLMLQDVSHPSDKELRDRDQDIVSRGLGILPLRNFDLLDEKQWYKEEHGVEMRRCLGILGEIVLLSQYAASLVTGALDANESSIKRHKFLQLPEYSFASEKLPVEDTDQFYLLRVLCDICLVIVDQKLTISFNGVLAGILTLLRNCAKHSIIKEDSQRHFLSVIHHIILARPSSFVLLLLVDLLTSLSSSPAVMKGLCVKCDDDDSKYDSSRGLCYLRKSTCCLQLICIQLQAVTEAHRWCVIDKFFSWIEQVIVQGSEAPSWILSTCDDNNQSHAACCIRLTTTFILLLLDTFEMLQEMLDEETESSPIDAHEDLTLKLTLIRIVRQSIIILLKLIENQMFNFMAQVEAVYEYLIQGIERLQKHLNFSSGLEGYLEDLLRTEQQASLEEQVSTDSPNHNVYLDGCIEYLSLL